MATTDIVIMVFAIPFVALVFIAGVLYLAVYLFIPAELIWRAYKHVTKRDSVLCIDVDRAADPVRDIQYTRIDKSANKQLPQPMLHDPIHHKPGGVPVVEVRTSVMKEYIGDPDYVLALARFLVMNPQFADAFEGVRLGADGRMPDGWVAAIETHMMYVGKVEENNNDEQREWCAEQLGLL